jgi:uncharacterized protein involved in exopolysaccharide biosynthesis
MQELRDELREVEDRLERFHKQNRVVQSPELVFQRDRLSREVGMRQQVYGTMVQAFEQARIDEVRDTPVISRVLEPTLPDRPSGPGPVRLAAYGLVTGATAAALFALFSARRKPAGGGA